MKEQNHVCVFFIHNVFSIPSSAQGKKGRKSKKLWLIIYILYIISALLLFMYGLSPLNTRPTKVFRTKSEEGAKSCVCLFIHNIFSIQSSAQGKKGRKGKKLWLIIYILYIIPALLLFMYGLSPLNTHPTKVRGRSKIMCVSILYTT